MIFKIAICPECKKKILVNVNTIGTPCECGTYLHKDTEDIRKEVKKEIVESADAFSRDFDEFKERFKNYEEEWKRTGRFVEFKKYEIEDSELITLLLSKKSYEIFDAKKG